MLGQSLLKNSALLAGFAFLTATVLGITYQLTRERIDTAQSRAEQAALQTVIPAERYDNDLFADTRPVPPRWEEALGIADWPRERKRLHVARQSGEPVALVLPTVAPDGYSGAIEMLMAVDMNGQILGLRVTAHRETPGLGDAIETRKSNWIRSFAGKHRSSTFHPPDPEYDQLTGATITREAVIRQVRRTLALHDETDVSVDVEGEARTK